MTGTWNAQTQCLGAFIRTRRKLARLSLRQLAEMTSLSDPYLSQLERGLHVPSVRVLKLLSEALNVSAETCWPRGPARPGSPRGWGRGGWRAPSIAGGVCHQRRRAPGRRAEGRADRRLPQHAPPLVHLSAAAALPAGTPAAGTNHPGHQPERGPGGPAR